MPLTKSQNATTVAGVPSATLEQTRRFDRRTTLQHVISHLAHQLGNPLNVIEGRAAMIEADPTSEAEARRHARIIVEQSARMARFLHETVTFCRRGKGAWTTVNLTRLVQSAVSVVGELAATRGATITVEAGLAGSSVRGDPDEILVALTHLLENGIRVGPPGGTLRVRLREVTGSEGVHGDASSSELCVDVDDDGPGIDAEVLGGLLEPFTTRHGAPEACGAGLFVAQAIANDHGGWIEGVNKAGAGARFTLHLPQGNDHAE